MRPNHARNRSRAAESRKGKSRVADGQVLRHAWLARRGGARSSAQCHETSHFPRPTCPFLASDPL